MSREDLVAEFVNLYREAWGTNEGLTKEKLANFTDSELQTNIRSLKEFIELR